MEIQSAYQPLRQDEELSEERDAISWNANGTNITPANTRNSVLFFSILLLSVTTNILLAFNNSKLRISHARGRSTFSGLNYDTFVPYHATSEYWSPNVSDSDMGAAWDSIDTNAVAVAFHNEYVKSSGLPPSTPFPWDTERSIYYVKGIHDLHCLKLIRKAISSKHKGEPQIFSLQHIYHCLDGLRQDIMCTADDTPMPSPAGHHVGEGQVRQCRDWSKLIAWAQRPDQHACYTFDDYREATNTLELFAFCPLNSPYRAFQQAYFEYHGHKDPYEPKDDGEPVVIF